MDTELDKAIAGFRLNNEAEALSPRTTHWYNGTLLLFQRRLKSLCTLVNSIYI